VLKRVFRLDDIQGESQTLLNLRWNDLIETTDWTNDDLDCIAELHCGESYTTEEGYKVTRQNS